MTNRFVSPEQQFINNAGQPFAGGFLYFYISGTSTPTPTYQDQGLTTPNSNPIVLDAAGNAGNIFLNSSIVYKVVLTDSNNNPIWTFDPVIPTDAPSNTVSAIISCTPSGGPNAITLTPINASQLPAAYSNYTVFAFVPSVTTTGSVTAQVGSLAFYPVFLTNGSQAGANDFVAGNGPYFIAYGSLVAGASPGFIMLTQSAGSGTVAISGTTTVSNIHNNKILQLGGGSFYTLTFPSGASLAANFRCIIVNEETTPVGKGVGGVDIGSFTLYPGQSYQIFNDGGTIRALGGKQIYVVNSVAIYLDTGLGSDNPLIADGLSTGARAFKTATAMYAAFRHNFDHNDSQPSMNTMTGNIQESVSFFGQPINCTVFFVNGPSPLATQWQPSTGQNFCWEVGDNCVMEFSNIAFDASNVAGATAIQMHQTSIADQNSGVGFGSFNHTTGNHISFDGMGGTYNVNAGYAVNGAGGASTHMGVPSAGFINVSGSITVTITNTPNIGNWFRAFGSGANISLGTGITFSGSVTAGCTKWNVGPGAVLNLSGNAANVPGSVAGSPVTGSAPTASNGWANA